MAAVRGTRRQTNATPVGFQIASASSSTRDMSDGETSASAVIVMTTGGGADVRETAAGDAASAAAARLVMISILPAIDGRDHQKFDVRIRDERTPLNLEIDRHDVLRKRDAELRNRDVPI